ncbi:tetratricopeptide repeat protein [Mesorhizobium koreense]|jgi:Flp pilus assembly protein TadD|uniref:tetratricopeptide repeat protein n=1 Tax=Mesorhizobium koreense TaxID=3074855 RepID=UPI00287BACCF|nr:tetratricopeptide repeat protein [Mesorhizobium sp. WR6]
MRASIFVVCGFLGAAFTASGCTTNPVDALSTISITPPARDVSADDLAQGKSQFRDGNYGLAEKHFRQAVELRPDSAEAWMGLAACYDELGRFDFADRAYGQLLKIAGRRPRIVNNMGYSQLLRGDKAKARRLLMEAEQSLPGDKLVAANIALLNKS